MLLSRFGQAEHVVEADGFPIESRVYLEVEGSVPATMAKSIGLGISEFATEFQRLRPHVVLLIGDRYEALAAAIAAAYMNIPLAHIQGGEVSGSIDECARHAITKFAQLHFPATQRSAEYLIRMGEPAETVFNFGCPAGDYILDLDSSLPEDLFCRNGVGTSISPNAPFFLVVYHPVTTDYGAERERVVALLKALDDLGHPTVWLWPNVDAGSDDISKVLRTYREHHEDTWLHLVKNLDPRTFQKCLRRTVCAIGNSSSFIRDSAFSGTPVVLVGERQFGREHSDNLVFAPARREAIRSAISRQLEIGRRQPSFLYGDGTASKRIAEKLRTFQFRTQKHLSYVSEVAASKTATAVGGENGFIGAALATI